MRNCSSFNRLESKHNRRPSKKLDVLEIFFKRFRCGRNIESRLSPPGMKFLQTLITQAALGRQIRDCFYGMNISISHFSRSNGKTTTNSGIRFRRAVNTLTNVFPFPVLSMKRKTDSYSITAIKVSCIAHT